MPRGETINVSGPRGFLSIEFQETGYFSPPLPILLCATLADLARVHARYLRRSDRGVVVARRLGGASGNQQAAFIEDWTSRHRSCSNRRFGSRPAAHETDTLMTVPEIPSSGEAERQALIAG